MAVVEISRQCCLFPFSLINPAISHASESTWSYNLEFFSSIQSSESSSFFGWSRIYSFLFWIQLYQSIGEPLSSLSKFLQEKKGLTLFVLVQIRTKRNEASSSSRSFNLIIIDHLAVEVYSNSQIFAAISSHWGPLPWSEFIRYPHQRRSKAEVPLNCFSLQKVSQLHSVIGNTMSDVRFNFSPTISQQWRNLFTVDKLRQRSNESTCTCCSSPNRKAFKFF
jgi:hypothetical protein